MGLVKTIGCTRNSRIPSGVQRLIKSHSSDNSLNASEKFDTSKGTEISCVKNPIDYRESIPKIHNRSRSISEDDSNSSTSSTSSDLSNSSSSSLRYTHEDAFIIALVICPLWFFANCTYNYSLLMTTVSSSTIISNLAGPFTLLFSWLAGIESNSWCKWLGILIGLGGVWLVAYGDDESAVHNQSHVTGDLVALAASAGYGLYTTVLKLQVPDDDATLMQLILGYLGLINTIMIAPLLIVMIMIDVIDLTKLSMKVFGFLLIGGFLDNAVADYLWARSVVLTSPTVATVGLGLTIPMAMLSDALLGKEFPTIIECFGAILVLVGFLIVSADGEETQIVQTVSDIGNVRRADLNEYEMVDTTLVNKPTGGNRIGNSTASDYGRLHEEA